MMVSVPTEEIKVLRDPVHGYIHINRQIIWDLINTREFQRLRRIHQMGGNYQVYHTAEHSRFSHSLGVYEIARRMCEEVTSVSQALSENEKEAVLCAALLHDIGHGPFSHCFEKISKTDHEDMGIRLIMNPSGQIWPLLKSARSDLPDEVSMILNHTHPSQLASAIVSSQLDADRMDYLLRDAFITGTSYGHFDLERILRTLRAKDGKLCIKESGVNTVEDYIMSRYQMYWQVYTHPDSEGFEVLIQKLMERYSVIRKERIIPGLEEIINFKSVDEFLSIDDATFYYGASKASDDSDQVLKDLADRIINRRLFDWSRTVSETELKNEAVKKGMDPETSVYTVDLEGDKLIPYRAYSDDPIWVSENDELLRLEDVSPIVKALVQVKDKSDHLVYFDKNLRHKNTGKTQ